MDRCATPLSAPLPPPPLCSGDGDGQTTFREFLLAFMSWVGMEEEDGEAEAPRTSDSSCSHSSRSSTPGACTEPSGTAPVVAIGGASATGSAGSGASALGAPQAPPQAALAKPPLLPRELSVREHLTLGMAVMIKGSLSSIFPSGGIGVHSPHEVGEQSPRKLGAGGHRPFPNYGGSTQRLIAAAHLNPDGSPVSILKKPSVTRMASSPTAARDLATSSRSSDCTTIAGTVSINNTGY